MIRRLFVIAVLIAAGITQSSVSLAASANSRAERLAEIQRQINDPNPLMRLAYMEEIAASGDATAIQLAIRTAMATDDEQLQSLSLRVYFSNLRSIHFQVESNQQADSDASDWTRVSYSLGYIIGNFDSSTGGFAAQYITSNLSDRYMGIGQVSGLVVRIQTPVRFQSGAGRNCNLFLEAGEDLVFRGTVNCDGLAPRTIFARMY